MHILSENDRGYLLFDGNELTIGSKVPDPAKVRVTGPVNADGGGGGVWSANISRQAGVVCDGHQQDEVAMIRVEQAQDVRGQLGNRKVEITLQLADGSGIGDVVKLLGLTWNSVTTLLPELQRAVQLALGADADVPDNPEAITPQTFSFPNKLVSPDGRVELDIQNVDALNMTLYKDGVALWSVLTGTTPEGRKLGLRA